MVTITNNFYEYMCKSLCRDKGIDDLNDNELNDFQYNFSKHLKYFPHFPDKELINTLSCEYYEHKNCVADFIFLPSTVPINHSHISFAYSNNNILFDNENRRLIRKMAESLDDEHALLFQYNDSENKYYVRGIVNSYEADNYFNDYYFISIRGYLKWSAKCKRFFLFDYDTGNFLNYNHYEKDIEKNILVSIDLFKNTFSNIDTENLSAILQCIAEQKHGTSLVVFNSSVTAQQQSKRLCEAGRGFLAEQELSADSLLECIPQLTKVDGGLILDKDLKCYAYGCIYDGKVTDSSGGSLARGSRYNSTSLYVDSFNSDEVCNCIGIVLSDDGGMECVTKCNNDK